MLCDGLLGAEVVAARVLVCWVNFLLVMQLVSVSCSAGGQLTL